MTRTPHLQRLLCALLATVATASAQAAKPLPPATPLGQAGTEALAARYTAGEHWVQKAVCILSLNQWWHPAGTPMLVDALRGKDNRLCAFGVEALLRSDDELLPMVATTDLLDELITHQLQRSNDLLQERVLAALKKLVPDAGATDRAGYARWWTTAKPTFAPAAWHAKDAPTAKGEGTVAAAQRAFDLYQNGLDLMMCIDSTGSMQPTIDAVGNALGEMVDILDGLSPKLRLGIVHYKDYGELGKPGAKVLLPLTKNVQSARKELGDLRAFGGGDLPEAVLGGLALALDDKMKWQKDANKVIVLIGDAPPHPEEEGKVLELVRNAYESPGSTAGKPTTGAKPDVKPFLTSAIGVVVTLEGNLKNQNGYREFVESQKVMRDDFAKIAKAGGGVYVEVGFTFSDQPEAKDKEKGRGKEKDKIDPGASAATKRIVEHILVLSFGERFAREMRDFVRVFYEYKEGGFLK